MSFELSTHGNVAVLHMVGPKANAMSAQWLAGLADAVDTQTSADALVVTGSGRMFSAGLDLPSLVDADRGQMREFMIGFAAALEKVMTFPRPTVAAVNGHAVAGGCVLALMCDYRVMAAGRSMIGLKESALGVGLPAIVLEPLRARVPARSLAPIAFSGQLFDPDEALALELIDDVVPAGDLMDSALERAAALAAPAAAAAQIKAALLRPLVAELRTHSEGELEAWLDTWFSPDGRRLVAEAVAALRK
jgi:enoyl-CoA hydratase